MNNTNHAWLMSAVFALAFALTFSGCGEPIDESLENMLVTVNPYEYPISVSIDGDSSFNVRPKSWFRRYLKAGTYRVSVSDSTEKVFAQKDVTIDGITKSHEEDKYFFIVNADIGLVLVDCYAVYDKINWTAEDLKIKNKYFGQDVVKIEDPYDHIHLPYLELPGTIYGTSISQLFIVRNVKKDDDEHILDYAARIIK